MSLFEGNVEDMNQGFSGDKKFPQPPFLQRSVSAPAIAEHVSEAIIPAFKYDTEEDLGINLSYQFPSRLNPRLPQTKKAGHEEGESAYAHLFSGENQKPLSLLGDSINESSLPAGLISSLMNDSQPRTPLDLIQADFPATPSSIYSKHLLQNNDARYEQDMQAAELKVAAITEDGGSFLSPPSGNSAAKVNPSNSTTQVPETLSSLVTSSHGIPPLIANSNGNSEDNLDAATKSFQKLYVNSDLSSIGGASTTQGLMPQYHPTNSSNAIPGATFFQSSSPIPGGNASVPAASNGSTLSLLGNVQHGFQAQGESVIPFPLGAANAPTSNGANLQSGGFDSRISLPASASNASLPSYSGILANNSAANSSATSNPSSGPQSNMASHLSHNSQLPGIAIASGTTNQQPPGMNMNMIPPLSIHPGNQQALQQAQYYIPQIYVNANGQPIYYRPNLPAGQFPQEFLYPAIVDQSGMPINANSLITDPNQLHLQQAQLGAYMQSFSTLSSLGGGPIQAAYWTAATDPNVQQGGIQMYPTSLQNMRVGLVEDPSRILYQQNLAFQNGLNPMQQLALQGQVNRGVANPNVNANMNYGMSPAVVPMNSATTATPMPGMIPRPHAPASVNGQLEQPPLGSFPSSDESRGPSGRDVDQQKDRRDVGNVNGLNSGHNTSGNQHRSNQNNNNNSNHGNSSNNNTNSGSFNRENRSARGNNGHVNNPVASRDSLVEEFRSTFGKSRQWSLKDLSNHIVAFCQDQHGSRFIQQKLEICSDVEKQLVFDEIFPSAQILMTDVFGNYVLQKLFEYGSKDQCEALASLLKGQAVQLSMQMYGCRVVQKALEYVSCDRLVDLVAEFDNPQMLIRCVHDSNGNHVIQKCIEVVSKAAKDADSKERMEFLSGKIQFIIDAFRGRVKELSSHPYGCRVVQRILEHCTDVQKAIILEELRGCCGELVQDCYGNYVIQFVMQHGWDVDRAVLIKEVQGHLLDYSQHKFASNVVEKCLQFASKKDRDEMIWTIINVTFDLNNPVDSKGHCVLESMVRDPYANYVVQKVIDVSDEKQRGAIMRYVKDNINQLRKYTYGKHIIVRLEKITNEKF